MSASYNGLLVTFKKDLCEEHVETIMQAIKLIKDVIDVRPVDDEGYNVSVSRIQATRECSNDLHNLLEKWRKRW